MLSVKLLCALGVVVGMSAAYRAPNPRPGSYNLPNIGRYPAPTPTFPDRNHGLPPVYHGKFKRAAEDYLGAADEGVAAFDEEPARFEAVRLARSVDLEGPEAFENADGVLPELTRARREYKIIRPTYRPPRRTTPRTVWV